MRVNITNGGLTSQPQFEEGNIKITDRVMLGNHSVSSFVYGGFNN